MGSIQFQQHLVLVIQVSNFNVVGQVIDADDNSRLLIDSVKLRANANNENETLVSSFTTTSSSLFNMSVPTDTQNGGTLEVLRPCYFGY